MREVLALRSPQAFTLLVTHKGIRPTGCLHALAFQPLEAKLTELGIREKLLQDTNKDGTFTQIIRDTISRIIRTPALSFADCKGREFGIYNNDPAGGSWPI